MPNPDPKASGMADRHLVPRTSFDPPTDWDSKALSAEQVNAQFLAQQAKDLASETQRQRELHGG